jgi:hypothetical protein
MVLIDTHAFYAFNVWWIYFPQPPWRDQPGRAPGPLALAEEHAPGTRLWASWTATAGMHHGMVL